MTLCFSGLAGAVVGGFSPNYRISITRHSRYWLFLPDASGQYVVYMKVDQKRKLAVFQNLNRQLSKLAKKPAARSVHKFRTYARRVEAWMIELPLAQKSNCKKLLRVLARLRRKAGRVRDLDVQIAALNNLKLPGSAAHKQQLLGRLAEERTLRAKKLANSFDRKTIENLRKRLRRVARNTPIPEGWDPLQVAARLLRNLDNNGIPAAEKTLHQYRISGKRARYVAELAGDDPEAVRLVKRLKDMQDVIGDWHDWLKLTARAEELFGGAPDSALVAALRNITRAKFRQAMDALSQTRAGLGPAPILDLRKSPGQVMESTTAVA